MIADTKGLAPEIGERDGAFGSQLLTYRSQSALDAQRGSHHQNQHGTDREALMGCLPSESGRNIGSPSSEMHGMIMHSRYDNRPSVSFLVSGVEIRTRYRSFTRREGIEGVDRIEP